MKLTKKPCAFSVTLKVKSFRAWTLIWVFCTTKLSKLDFGLLLWNHPVHSYLDFGLFDKNGTPLTTRVQAHAPTCKTKSGFIKIRFIGLGCYGDFLIDRFFYWQLTIFGQKKLTSFLVFHFRFCSPPIRSQKNPTWPTFFPFSTNQQQGDKSCLS